ncbi:MAG TPA: small multi-drug export protein [Candidatus Eisenbacteria bacterium]|jgi:uncharacterized membrane protein|nr:small multi-drug export protein [Candidatus Eisenbacteria bacterium]
MTAFPPELVVGMLAMLPVTELRVAIPVGVVGFHLPVGETFLVAEIGNAVPVVIVYALCDRIAKLAERRRGFWHRWAHKLMHRSHRRVHAAVQRWGPFALTIFVGLPLPGTGVWFASIGAYLLHIPFRRAFPFIILGNLIAGVIVTLAVTGAVAAFRIFLPMLDL